MIIGRMDQRITLQRKTRTSDGMGGFTEAWTNLATVYADIRPLGSREIWEAMRVSAETRFRVRVRWREDADGAPYYTSADRISWRGRIYGIDRVVEMGRREGLEIMMVEGASS